jgi:uncharacterized membrane protein
MMELGIGFIMTVVFVGFWALVVVLLVKLVRSPRDAPAQSAGLRVLEERYARGEITHEEFTERKAVLAGQPPTGAV